MMPLTATKASAQTRYRTRQRESRTYYNNDSYYNNGSYNDGYTTNTGAPNVYDRHRKAMNIAIATGAGAIIGALIGGKKGALIGAGAGVATGAIITAKQAPRNYYKY
jgi:hypothetical protein